MSAVGYRSTVVNGYDVDIWECDDEMAVRQFAAALDRAGSGIRAIESDTLSEVCVWLGPAVGEEHAARITTPDGWQVDNVKVTRSGGVAVKYSRVDR